MRPDVAGVFASDAHRRVLAHIDHHDRTWSLRGLPKTRDTLETLSAAMRLDDGMQVKLDPSEVEEIVADLEAEGYVKKTKAGVLSRTAAGLKALKKEAEDA